ncbi:MupA/Atu3671 family FMN-dependent luciferase-like monooxygenase [Dactylosporangium matsuzakiense]|uniref:Siderophore biosynthesis protein n=1 Tax=Dactylosporangium matsuzakiense TaxID=53360 RepID=A0A9W6KJ27_9ACTN|nr:MupA/Atu3671 family FMN-dependent luciferase-like monooxygenase [Dactylosporangium matsuzakiense]GLL02118.1 siderophore biosynthesis protein [Dactylosporangium matsuzakiense]
MDFSVFYFADDGMSAGTGERYDLLLRGARFADENGFAAVWTPERHFHSFGGLYPNPSVTGAAIAVTTSRIQVRAGSIVLPLQDPVRVVEEWSVVDNLSGGRTGMALASGWHPTDFALRPEAYQDRERLLVDGVDQVRWLWRGEPVRRVDGLGGEQEIRTLPRPISPEPRLWIACAGSAGKYELAGRLGANVLTHLLNQDVPTLGQKIAAYRRTLSDHHPGATSHVTLMLHTFLGADTNEVRALVHEPLSRYLRSSLDLTVSDRNQEGRLDAAGSSSKHRRGAAAMAFDRYFSSSGLFGTVADARLMLDTLTGIGVDEIACLIDFGVDAELVLESLQLVSQLIPNA